MVPVLAIAGSLGRKQAVPAIGGHVPDRHRAVRRDARGRDGDHRRPDVLPCPGARPVGGALRLPHLESRCPLSPPSASDAHLRPLAGTRSRASCGTARLTAFVKLDPRHMLRNPVMFTVEVDDGPHAGVLDQGLRVLDAVDQRLWRADHRVAVVHRPVRELRRGDGRGPRQGPGRRAAQDARRDDRQGASRDGAIRRGRLEPSCSVGDVCVVVAGELIPGDGEIIEGIASVDESAITGESAPVIRESGGDRSAVTGGTRVLSDRIVVRITAEPGRDVPRPHDRAGRRRRAARRPPTRSRSTSCSPGSRIIFLLAVVTLQPFAIYSGAPQSITVLVALLVCLIPTTIGALLSAIGIAGMDRLVQRNVLAMCGRAVEAAGDCRRCLLDKTGTITFGNRQAAEFIPVPGVAMADAGRGRACCRAWPTRRPRAARSWRSPRSTSRRASGPSSPAPSSSRSPPRPA